METKSPTKSSGNILVTSQRKAEGRCWVSGDGPYSFTKQILLGALLWCGESGPEDTQQPAACGLTLPVVLSSSGFTLTLYRILQLKSQNWSMFSQVFPIPKQIGD